MLCHTTYERAQIIPGPSVEIWSGIDGFGGTTGEKPERRPTPMKGPARELLELDLDPVFGCEIVGCFAAIEQARYRHANSNRFPMVDPEGQVESVRARSLVPFNVKQSQLVSCFAGATLLPRQSKPALVAIECAAARNFFRAQLHLFHASLKPVPNLTRLQLSQWCTSGEFLFNRATNFEHLPINRIRCLRNRVFYHGLGHRLRSLILQARFLSWVGW